MPNQTDTLLNHQTCSDCPHYNPEDTEWNADRSDFNTYCLLKGQYCIENGDDPICSEREEEIKSKYDSLNTIFVPYYDLSLKWLSSHGFKREKEEISPELETYCYKSLRTSDNKSPIIVSPRYVISTGIWEVKVTCGEDDFYSSGYLDVRDSILDILPKLKELLG